MEPRFALDEIKNGLETRQRDLAAELARHDAIAVTSAPEVMEDMNLAVDREMATVDLERKFRLVRQIADALVRLEAGEYGWCLRCGAEIAAARLQSVPWAAHCLRCQETTECRDRSGQRSAVERRGR